MARTVLLFLALAAGSAHVAPAQDRVGEVSRIALDRNVYRPAVSTDTAEVVRVAGALSVETRLDLLRRDVVQLKQPVFIHARFDQAGAEGNAFMSPDPGTGRGTYEIQENTAQALSTLQLGVKLGTMVLERVGGRIVTCLAGHCIEALGTTLLFQVTQAEDEPVGICYLREGHIRFVASGQEIEGRDRIWELRPGQPPIVMNMDRTLRRRFRDDVRFHTETVWQRRVPLLRRPGFWYGAVGLGVIGTGAYVAYRAIRPDGRIDVVVTLPN